MPTLHIIEIVVLDEMGVVKKRLHWKNDPYAGNERSKCDQVPEK